MLDDWRQWSAAPTRLEGRRATLALVAADLALAVGLLLGAVAWLELPDGEPGLRLGVGVFTLAWVGGCAWAIVKLGRAGRAGG